MPSGRRSWFPLSLSTKLQPPAPGANLCSHPRQRLRTPWSQFLKHQSEHTSGECVLVSESVMASLVRTPSSAVRSLDCGHVTSPLSRKLGFAETSRKTPATPPEFWDVVSLLSLLGDLPPGSLPNDPKSRRGPAVSELRANVASQNLLSDALARNKSTESWSGPDALFLFPWRCIISTETAAGEDLMSWACAAAWNPHSGPFLGSIQLVSGAALMTGSRCWGGRLKAESWPGWYAHLLKIAAEFALTVSQCQGAKKWDVTSSQGAELHRSAWLLSGIFLRNDSQQRGDMSLVHEKQGLCVSHALNFPFPSVQTMASVSLWPSCSEF